MAARPEEVPDRRPTKALQPRLSSTISTTDSATCPVTPPSAPRRSALAISSPEELAEIFDAFGISASYDKRDHSLEVMATVVPELWNEEDREAIRPATRAGRRTPLIAGAGFEPATSGL